MYDNPYIHVCIAKIKNLHRQKYATVRQKIRENNLFGADLQSTMPSEHLQPGGH